MFTADHFIDSVQNAKKTFVNTVFADAKFKEDLVKLIDTQTEFAKGQVKTTLSIVEAFVKNASEAVYAKKGA
jgi:hypothetical protein